MRTTIVLQILALMIPQRQICVMSTKQVLQCGRHKQLLNQRASNPRPQYIEIKEETRLWHCCVPQVTYYVMVHYYSCVGVYNNNG